MANYAELMDVYLRLTYRQREVLFWVQQGLSNREIGEQLCIEACSVADHLTAIYAELGALDDFAQVGRATRYALIRLFSGFFDAHPEMACF